MNNKDSNQYRGFKTVFFVLFVLALLVLLSK